MVYEQQIAKGGNLISYMARTGKLGIDLYFILFGLSATFIIPFVIFQHQRKQITYIQKTKNINPTTVPDFYNCQYDLDEISIQKSFYNQFTQEIMEEKNKKLTLHKEIHKLTDMLFPNKWWLDMVYDDDWWSPLKYSIIIVLSYFINDYINRIIHILSNKIDYTWNKGDLLLFSLTDQSKRFSLWIIFVKTWVNERVLECIKVFQSFVFWRGSPDFVWWANILYRDAWPFLSNRIGPLADWGAIEECLFCR